VTTAARAAALVDEPDGDEVVGQTGEEEGVEAVEDATVAEQEAAGVFCAGVAFQERLKKVTGKGTRDCQPAIQSM
jgi:hypothetical protein